MNYHRVGDGECMMIHATYGGYIVILTDDDHPDGPWRLELAHYREDQLSDALALAEVNGRGPVRANVFPLTVTRYRDGDTVFAVDETQPVAAFEQGEQLSV